MNTTDPSPNRDGSPPLQCSADTIIRNLLRASDAGWYQQNEGHDWREAVDAAEQYLAGGMTPPTPRAMTLDRENENT